MFTKKEQGLLSKELIYAVRQLLNIEPWNLELGIFPNTGSFYVSIERRFMASVLDRVDAWLCGEACAVRGARFGIPRARHIGLRFDDACVRVGLVRSVFRNATGD